MLALFTASIALSFHTLSARECTLDLVQDCGAETNSEIDNTAAFVTCQTKLQENGLHGGSICVPSGTYHVINVPLNTPNIIYYMSSKVTFIAYQNNATGDPVFNVGSTTSFVQNISIIGDSPTNKFVIDTTNGMAQRGIELFGLDGFLLANIEILAKVTDPNARSAITFYYNRISDTLIYHPTNGQVINITTSDYPTGYGLTQIQSGENIYFENLDGTGGITLRIETGAGDQEGYVNNITANNVICRNGFAGISTSPHTQKNGYFEIRNVVSYSCYIGYLYAFGYSQDGRTPGYFTNGSIVHNLTSYYGTKAQVDKNDTGPSCGPCGTENTKNPQNYVVNITGMYSMDFPPPADRNSCPRWNRHPSPPICPWDNSSYPSLFIV